jgi:ribose 5-phosphate isomerase B
MRIVVGSDDAGIDYRQALAKDLEESPLVDTVIDIGVEPDDDTAYPELGLRAAQLIADGEADRALLFCGTGLGVAIAANRVKGVRAVTAHDLYSVQRSVLSNNAQVLCMGQRVIGLESARALVEQWLPLEFDPDSPSAAKVALIDRDRTD